MYLLCIFLRVSVWTWVEHNSDWATWLQHCMGLHLKFIWLRGKVKHISKNHTLRKCRVVALVKDYWLEIHSSQLSFGLKSPLLNLLIDSFLGQSVFRHDGYVVYLSMLSHFSLLYLLCRKDGLVMVKCHWIIQMNSSMIKSASFIFLFLFRVLSMYPLN